jgi:uncharacterized protein YjbJ (UPF0337 family)
MFDKAKAKADQLAEKAQGAAAEHDLSGKVDKAGEKTGELASKLEAKADQLAGKAQNAAADRKPQMSEAIDKAAKTADERTKGKYHDQISRTADKAHGYVDRLEHRDERGTSKGTGEPGDGADSTAGESPPPGEGR